ncbi:MAG: hypothetical protein H6965_04440 [Chromatiaceae bacterium]|nr:hypothetical protein [Chromatiaceae bacterium]
MIDEAVSRDDITLESFHSKEETYLVSFGWGDQELHTFGRKCGNGAVFLLKRQNGKSIGFITFSIAPGGKMLTITTGGTTGKYRNKGFGLPLLDSFCSLALVLGIEQIEFTMGHNNPFVLMLITQTYGFGPVEQHTDQALIIGTPSKQHPDRYPVFFIGEEARRLIQHSETEEPPDPFGPRYQTIDRADLMPANATTVYIRQPYQIMDRSKLYRRIFTFLPQIRHHPDPDQPAQRVVWKSHALSKAQSFLLAEGNNPPLG